MNQLTIVIFLWQLGIVPSSRHFLILVYSFLTSSLFKAVLTNFLTALDSSNFSVTVRAAFCESSSKSHCSDNLSLA